MNKLKILVVEDDKLAQKVMATHLAGHDVDFADNFETGKRRLGTGAHDLCFLDLQLGDGDNHLGLQLIPIAVERGIYPVVMSGCEAEDMVSKAYELGCKDYFTKGNEESNIGTVIGKYHRSKAGVDVDGLFSSRFITQDPATKASILEAVKYAVSDLPILILGPSGTGKTSLGQIIHEHSRREGEFVAINCSAYTEELLEAELFGCKKGAFTGATESRKGRLLQAHNGTLFLDEIGAMSFNMQTKLLKAIEERSFYPLGSDRPEHSEFRLISATLEDLQKLIAQGRLRFDFFQRIHGLTVSLKPLAQRKCDIMPLVQFFMKGGKRLSFAAEARGCLMEHSWPGNIRELKRFVDLLAAGADGRVTPEEIRRHLGQAGKEAGAVPVGFVEEVQYLYAMEAGLPAAMDRFAEEVIRRNLSENGGVRTKTMAELKISTRLLYSTLKKRGGSDGR